jgi:quinoprotein glucose dehydrogenase
VLVSLTGLRAAPADEQEWRTYGGDLGSTRYSPLSQIDASNFSSLEVAWRFKTDTLGPRPDFLYQATPLMVNGVVYVTAGTRRAVVALDAASGELLWMHAENEGARGDAAPRKGAGRGVAYWTDGRDARVIYVTPGYRMIALDAKTGVPVPGFGRAGAVDLKLESDQTIDLTTGEMGLNATPIIAGNIIVVGSAHRAGGAPKSKRNARGAVRAYDARTGKRLWIFHTIPHAGEFGYDTWDPESNAYSGNTGAWAQMSVDESLGLVYVGVEMPTGDYYGGHRPGTPCSTRASSPSISRPASDDGTFSSSITASGTWIRRAPPFWPTSSLTDGASKPSRSPRSRRGCTSSIVRREGPCGQSRSGRFHSPRCLASRPARPNPS